MEQDETSIPQKNPKTGPGIKYGGRQKGVQNRLSQNLRNEIHDIVEASLDNLMVDLEMMKPADRVNAIIQLAKFSVPTLKAVEVKDVSDNEGKKKFAFNFKKSGDGGE